MTNLCAGSPFLLREREENSGITWDKQAPGSKILPRTFLFLLFPNGKHDTWKFINKFWKEWEGKTELLCLSRKITGQEECLASAGGNRGVWDETISFYCCNEREALPVLWLPLREELLRQPDRADNLTPMDWKGIPHGYGNQNLTRASAVCKNPASQQNWNR